MKTAISIPDDLFQTAEDLARELGMSRSELYSKAVEQYVQRHAKKDLVERINKAICQQDTRLEPDLEHVSTTVLKEQQW